MAPRALRAALLAVLLPGSLPAALTADGSTLCARPAVSPRSLLEQHSSAVTVQLLPQARADSLSLQARSVDLRLDVGLPDVGAAAATSSLAAVLVHLPPGWHLAAPEQGDVTSEECVGSFSAVQISWASTAPRSVELHFRGESGATGGVFTTWAQLGGDSGVDSVWLGPLTPHQPAAAISRRRLLQDPAAAQPSPASGPTDAAAGGGGESTSDMSSSSTAYYEPWGGESTSSSQADASFSDSASTSDTALDSSSSTTSGVDYAERAEEIVAMEAAANATNSTTAPATQAAAPTTPATPVATNNATAKDAAGAAAASGAAAQNHPTPAGSAAKETPAAANDMSDSSSSSSSSDGNGHVLRHARTHLVGFFTSADTSVHPGVVAFIVVILVGGSVGVSAMWWRSNRHTASAMVPPSASPQLELLPTSRSGGTGGGTFSSTPLLGGASKSGAAHAPKPPPAKGKLGAVKKGHGGGHFELLGSEDV